VNINQTSK